ncbi:MAG: hypothetical protein J6X78_05605 [Treponema sp.]|nr:hypothetical protein [Treponema sp.]
MKLDPIFTVKQNKLYKLADNTLLDITTLKHMEIKWSEVELADEAYNEEYLAELREELKRLEAQNLFAVLIPVVDKPLQTPEQIELFINAFNHTARRVKDCVSVAGLELAPELIQQGFESDSPADQFMETLAIKHAQYVYFVKKAEIQKLTFSAPEDKIVLY